MKKSLLIAAMGLMSLGAYADYAEYYSVSYEGKDVKNGETIVVPVKAGESTYEITLGVTVNKGDEEVPTYLSGSMDESYAKGGKFVGGVQFCSDANCYPVAPGFEGNLGYREPNADFDYYAGDEFSYLIHLTDIPADAANINQIYSVSMQAFTGEMANAAGDYSFEQIEGTAYKMYIQFCNSEFASVEGLEVEEGEAEYYNLQGVRIEKPEHGIVIVKKGNDVKKVVL